jgi:Flp pilus assembly protein CpaB
MVQRKARFVTLARALVAASVAALLAGCSSQSPTPPIQNVAAPQVGEASLPVIVVTARRLRGIPDEATARKALAPRGAADKTG